MWRALQQFFKPHAPVRVPPPAPERRRVAAPTVAAPPGPTVIGANRPLVAPDGALAGFEFRLGPGLVQRLRRHEDGPAARLVAQQVLAAMRLSLAPGRVALAELPASWLAACDDEAFAKGMLVVTGDDADAALIRRLRALGVAVGWRVQDMPPGIRPDFLCCSPEQARTMKVVPGMPWVVPDLQGLDELEALLRSPVMLAACQPGGEVEASKATALAPQAARLMRVLACLVRDGDHAVVVDEIQADPALSLRLVQYLNSAGASPGRVLASVDEAVTVLGRDALYRWCSQLLVRCGQARPAGPALQAMALARARLLEQLARMRGQPQPGRFYLLGLVSLLPQVLRTPLSEALAALQLPEEARQALCEGTGPMAPYLALSQAIEAADLTRAEPLAEPFGGLAVVLASAAQGWR